MSRLAGSLWGARRRILGELPAGTPASAWCGRGSAWPRVAGGDRWNRGVQVRPHPPLLEGSRGSHPIDRAPASMMHPCPFPRKGASQGSGRSAVRASLRSWLRESLEGRAEASRGRGRGLLEVRRSGGSCRALGRVEVRFAGSRPSPRGVEGECGGSGASEGAGWCGGACEALVVGEREAQCSDEGLVGAWGAGAGAAPWAGVGAVGEVGWSVSESGGSAVARESGTGGWLAWKRGAVCDDRCMALYFRGPIVFGLHPAARRERAVLVST